MKTLVVMACGLALVGCSTADMARRNPSNQTVILYAADGSQIGKWHARGLVKSEDTSDGWYFVDNKTGHLVICQGTIVIESDTPSTGTE